MFKRKKKRGDFGAFTRASDAQTDAMREQDARRTALGQRDAVRGKTEKRA